MPGEKGAGREGVEGSPYLSFPHPLPSTRLGRGACTVCELQDSFVSFKQGQGQGHRLLPPLEASSLPCPFCEASSAQTYFRAASCPRAYPIIWSSTTWNHRPWVLFLSQTGAQNRDCPPLAPKPRRPRYSRGPVCAACSRQPVPSGPLFLPEAQESPRPIPAACLTGPGAATTTLPPLVQVPAPVTSEFPSFPLQC